MAPPRTASNGRSPLVNQQRQITSFFTKQTSELSPPSASTLSPSPTLSKKQNPSSNPSTSPTTPSPFQSKNTSKKPILVIGPASTSPTTPDTSERLYGPEVVNKRIKVYWPLDKCWYGGCVKYFDKVSGEHLVQYDDGEEESLNLSEEKVEWPIDEPPKRFRRLRKLSVLEDSEEEKNLETIEDHDDSADEDWGSNTAKEAVEDVSDGMDLDDEVIDDEVCGKIGINRKKRKASGNLKLNSNSSKKINKAEDNKKNMDNVSVGVVALGKSTPEAGNDLNSGKVFNDNKGLVGDIAERFGARETEKLWFLGKDRKDAKKRRPGDEDYDPKTLYMPPEFLKGLSGGQRQWWEFKSKHMDKVLFFKMGKFYELYEMDAHIGAKELDLQYMKGEQPHCGFPEKNFSINVEKLAQKGYRVLVVEQTETPEQLELRRREKGSKDKVVKREICAVVTKGTLADGEMLSASPDASYLMAITESRQSSVNHQGEHTYGICVVDVATSKIMLGQFKDDSDSSVLCCLLSELRPVEIIKPAKWLSPETERVVLRHTRNPLINELIPLSEFWDAGKTISEVSCFYRRVTSQSSSLPQNDDFLLGIEPLARDSDNCIPDVLTNLVAAGEDGSYALSALGGALSYLRKAFLDESLLRFAKFELLPSSGLVDFTQKPYMVLDAAAFENLEIFENNRNGDSSGTLYAQLNHCVTGFGKRLLKKWLARPLYHLESIQERQVAIAGLKGDNLPSVLEFRKELLKLPDMERLLARIFSSCVSNGRNATKVVLYEDAAKKQLQEFILALRGCELMIHACSSLGSILANVDSVLLHHLLTLGKGLPEAQSVLKHFKDAFDWTEAHRSGRIIPAEGVDSEYDAACKKVSDIESNLKKHLKEQRKLLGDASIDYVTIGKDAYLLEVPESLCKSIPREYELQSSKKGYFRYWTPIIKKSIGELSHAESEKEAKLKNILQRLVEHFSMHHDKWRRLVSTTAELDVLISLSIASDYYEGPSCSPDIRGLSCPDELPYVNAKGLGHPLLRSDTLGKGAFVPNDVTLGGSGKASFILLTGPNMGGKSTLLRQVCLAVILAQIGADVPAQSFVMSPVDCIFVRMGARDHIMAGQSTFLTELLETSLMLSSATRNSIVALDELGRGTSTSDGQAIAESVLEHFIHKVQCRGMFSTHYHRLAIDYASDPKVLLCHMACQVGKGAEGLEDVTFLYRLTPGACPKSYGVNVARLAGLPDSVLKKAASKSQEFEETYGKNRCSKGITLLHRSREEEELDSTMKTLLNLLANRSCHDSNEKEIVGPLSELQNRARIVLENNLK